MFAYQICNSSRFYPLVTSIQKFHFVKFHIVVKRQNYAQTDTKTIDYDIHYLTAVYEQVTISLDLHTESKYLQLKIPISILTYNISNKTKSTKNETFLREFKKKRLLNA